MEHAVLVRPSSEKYNHIFGPTEHSFYIPILDWEGNLLPLGDVEHYVNRFIIYARINSNKKFKINRMGSKYAKLFKYAPNNCFFHPEWEELLPNKSFY